MINTNNLIYARTTLNYLSGMEPTAIPVEIMNGRLAEVSFDEHGFELVNHQSVALNLASRDQAEADHYTEIRAFAKARTGCDFVLFFPAVWRDPSSAAINEDYNPIQLVHSDYTEGYANVIRNRDHPYHQLMTRFMEAEKVSSTDVESASRILTLQLWRNLGSDLMDYPLAFCDGRSVARDELLPHLVETYGGVPTRFESFLVMAPTTQPCPHRWYIFPRMKRDEVVVFRAFDSELATAGRPFWTPHTAFLDPTLENAQPRESIEMRPICFWK